MGYTSELVVDVAMHDIDVAFSGLVFKINNLGFVW